jgi:hypothetical protein
LTTAVVNGTICIVSYPIKEIRLKKYTDKWFRSQPVSGTDQEKEDHRRFVESQIDQETSKFLSAYDDEPGFRRQLIRRLVQKEFEGEYTNE